MTAAAGRGGPAPAWKCDNGYVRSSTEPRGDARKAGGEVTTTARCTYGGRVLAPRLRAGSRDRLRLLCSPVLRASTASASRITWTSVAARAASGSAKTWMRTPSGECEWSPRTAVSVCADERCDLRMRHECSRCRLLFCADHVRAMRGRDSSRQRPAAVKALVCAHCAKRRKIWN